MRGLHSTIVPVLVVVLRSRLFFRTGASGHAREASLDGAKDTGWKPMLH
jgi:hypothetical protein